MYLFLKRRPKINILFTNRIFLTFLSIFCVFDKKTNRFDSKNFAKFDTNASFVLKTPIPIRYEQCGKHTF